MSIVYELAVIIIVATVLAYLAKALKQQIIPAYIIAGVFLGPIAGRFLGNIGIITNLNLVKEMSELGITFLLFIVGMEIKFNKLKDVGLVAIMGTVIQFVIIFVSGFILSTFFFTTIESLFLGLTLAFGSTMVVIDTLTRNNEIDTLHGKICISILLVQDIIAILSITLLAGFSTNSGGLNTLAGIFVALLKAILLLFIALISIKIMPKIFKFAARSQELLFMCAISVAFIFAILAQQIGNILAWILTPLGLTQGSQLFELITPGFSLAIGGFLGGVTIGSLPYAVEISGKVSSLKEFFATIFFVSLGMEIKIFQLNSIIIPAIIMLIFLISIKPLTIALVTALFGFEKKTSFITGISLFQVSEFAIIINTLGLAYNLITPKIFSLTILLAGITMVLTSYSITYKNTLFNKIGDKITYLHLITKKNEKLQFLPEKGNKEVILIGFNRIGYSIFKTLRRMKKQFIILDYNPETIKRLIKEKIHCIYGDASDTETLDKLNLSKAKTMISTVPDFNTNLLLVEKARKENKKIVIFVTAYNNEDALELYDKGADYVILPHQLGGEHVSLMLEDITIDISKMIMHRFNHIFDLKEKERMKYN